MDSTANTDYVERFPSSFANFFAMNALPTVRPDQDAETAAMRLVDFLKSFDDAVVAFSGGVDSAVVAAACFRAFGDRSVAVTGIGPAVSDLDKSSARVVCHEIGIRHVELQTQEIEDPNYVRNDFRRCYFCKSTLFQSLQHWVDDNNFRNLFSGTNFDDLGDYRPGLQAGKENRVITPLADLGLGKSQVRQLAKYFGLSVSDKPASPCLASRIAYGVPVSTELLRKIETMETALHQLGFSDMRARAHAGDLLRLELHPSDWPRLIENEYRDRIVGLATELGFRYVTMDLMARQTGSMNRLLPILDHQ